MSDPNYIIFDRKFHTIALKKCFKNYHQHDFLIKEISQNIAERLQEISKKFTEALIYGLFDSSCVRGSLDKITYGNLIAGPNIQNSNNIIYDEELIPFESHSFDLIISNLSLHFINDLPGALIQYQKTLKLDGLFIATIFGPKTLNELRNAFWKTDELIYKGCFPRIIPLPDIRDVASLLQRSNFKMPIVDTYEIKVKYSSLYNLLQDIKGIGQSNCLIERNKTIPP